jgi:hypothetical protein
MPCTAKELALAVELSERRVSALTSSGIFTKPYDLVRCVRAYIRFLKKPTGALTDERARLTKAQADLFELKLKRQSGELVLRSAVEAEVFRMARMVRDQFMNVPSRIDALVAAEPDREKCFQILTRVVRQCLESLQTQHAGRDA